jgi:RNA polymerase sigma-70 factor, ECF subfamily
MSGREENRRAKPKHRPAPSQESTAELGQVPSSPPGLSRVPSTRHQPRDASFAARLRAGDAAAFEEMVLAYAEPLAAFTWRYLRSDDAALDLTQEVFAHMWQHQREITIRGSVRAYLFAAARNRALNAIEHQRVEARWSEWATGAGLTGIRPPARADERAERAEVARAVETALRTLPPRAQEIARLRWVDQLSKREIAEVLGIAVPTVSVQLTRAVKRLRALLRGFDPRVAFNQNCLGRI